MAPVLPKAPTGPSLLYPLRIVGGTRQLLTLGWPFLQYFLAQTLGAKKPEKKAKNPNEFLEINLIDTPPPPQFLKIYVKKANLATSNLRWINTCNRIQYVQCNMCFSHSILSLQIAGLLIGNPYYLHFSAYFIFWPFLVYFYLQLFSYENISFIGCNALIIHKHLCRSEFVY